MSQPTFQISLRALKLIQLKGIKVYVARICPKGCVRCEEAGCDSKKTVPSQGAAITAGSQSSS